MLLTKSNTKLLKGETQGYRSFGVHLAPYKISGKNMCPNASKGCAAACLNVSGQGYYARVQEARLKKTRYFIERREEFLQELKKDIETSIRRAKKNNMIPCFRLNLTSDIPWENVKVEDGKSFMEIFPEVQFYDYSKGFDRMKRFLLGEFPSNYHLTFSRSESNRKECDDIRKLKGNIAVVFRKKLPKTYMGKRVIDGTKTDLRFLDKKNVVVGLIDIGLAKKDKTGFVVGTR